jgi:hypothetical protein
MQPLLHKHLMRRARTACCHSHFHDGKRKQASLVLSFSDVIGVLTGLEKETAMLNNNQDPHNRFDDGDGNVSDSHHVTRIRH